MAVMGLPGTGILCRGTPNMDIQGRRNPGRVWMNRAILGTASLKPTALMENGEPEEEGRASIRTGWA